MTRTLGSQLATDVGAASAETVDLILLDFANSSNVSTPVYLTTAARDFAWNSQTWQAVGGRLELDALGESADDSTNALRLNLSGVDQAILALILGARYRGRTATVYYAHINPATGMPLADPIVMFTGLMNGGVDLMESRGDFGGGTVDITLRLTAKLNELVRVRGVRTNVPSHQNTIPGATTDTLFATVDQLALRKVYWGMKTPVDTPATPPWIPGPGPAPPTNTFGVPGGNPLAPGSPSYGPAPPTNTFGTPPSSPTTPSSPAPAPPTNTFGVPGSSPAAPQPGTTTTEPPPPVLQPRPSLGF